MNINPNTLSNYAQIIRDYDRAEPSKLVAIAAVVRKAFNLSISDIRVLVAQAEV